MLAAFVQSRAISFFEIHMLNFLTVHPIFHEFSPNVSPGFSGGIPGGPRFDSACSMSVVPHICSYTGPFLEKVTAPKLWESPAKLVTLKKVTFTNMAICSQEKR